MKLFIQKWLGITNINKRTLELERKDYEVCTFGVSLNELDDRVTNLEDDFDWKVQDKIDDEIYDVKSNIESDYESYIYNEIEDLKQGFTVEIQAKLKEIV